VKPQKYMHSKVESRDTTTLTNTFNRIIELKGANPYQGLALTFHLRARLLSKEGN
jgi:hypothetical protein